MIRLHNSCCFYDGSTVQYVFEVDQDEQDNTFSRAIDENTRVVENGNIYTQTGNIATGVPAVQQVHFYYPLPAS